MVFLKGIDIEIEGELLLTTQQVKVDTPKIIGLVGKNGSGKTTLLKHIREQHKHAVYVPQIKKRDAVLSGGENSKRYLLDSLNQMSTLYLFDEPTMHLDENNIEWLTENLKRLDGVVVVVSHDRYFLDLVVDEIWSIHDAQLNIYKGNYTHFKTVFGHEEERHKEEYRQYVHKKRALEDKIKRKRDQAKTSNVAKGIAGFDDGSSPYFNKIQKKMFKSATAMESRLSQLEEVEQPKKVRKIEFYHHTEEKFGQKIMLRFDQGLTIGNRTLLNPSKLFIRNGEHVGIKGSNGSGKTTLLNHLVETHQHLQIGYFHQQHENLDTELTILQNILYDSDYDESTARTMLGRLDIKREKVNTLVKHISGGERVKVQLVKLLLSRNDLLLLDEPSNFLDIVSIEALEEMLKIYPNTFVLVSHDKRLMENVCDKIFVMDNQSLTEHVEITETDKKQESLMVIENEIASVISQMSIEHTDELEERFQALLKRKHELS